MAPSALFLCLVVACCPPLHVSYATPEDTLATWQAQLCQDQPEGEYRCLSRDLQQMMGGFETYFAARQRLLNDDPIVGFMVQRVDLASRAVENSGSSDGNRHRMVFEESGERFAIEFSIESMVTFHLADGRALPGRMTGPIDDYLDNERNQQWVIIPQPYLTSQQQADVRSVVIEQQWKIASIQGLTARPEVTE